MHSTTILDQTGDVTILWDESSDDDVEKIIQKKMKEGMVFFIIEPRFFGFLPPKKTELKKAKDARKHRALSIKDEDFSSLVASGIGEVATSQQGTIKTKGRAKTAKEAVKSSTVGVKPVRGG